MAATTLGAESVQTNDQREEGMRAARETLSNWKDFRGFTPFGDAGSGHAVDRANGHLGNASAILGMLAAACSDAGALISAGKGSEFDSRNMDMLAGALEGVSTLIDLGSFMLED